ncbi:MAG: GreA/GreB family elongation factor [Verrucomicrobiota bacterium]
MLKSITLSNSDHLALKAHVARALAAGPKDRDTWKRLDQELARASLVPDILVPADVVRVGSVFTVRHLDTDEHDTFTLVWPEQADLGRNRLSVLTPLGNAVIGFAAGDEITWQMPRGTRRLRLESVSLPAHS